MLQRCCARALQLQLHAQWRGSGNSVFVLRGLGVRVSRALTHKMSAGNEIGQACPPARRLPERGRRPVGLGRQHGGGECWPPPAAPARYQYTACAPLTHAKSHRWLHCMRCPVRLLGPRRAQQPRREKRGRASRAAGTAAGRQRARQLPPRSHQAWRLREGCGSRGHRRRRHGRLLLQLLRRWRRRRRRGGGHRGRRHGLRCQPGVESVQPRCGALRGSCAGGCGRPRLALAVEVVLGAQHVRNLPGAHGAGQGGLVVGGWGLFWFGVRLFSFGARFPFFCGRGRGPGHTPKPAPAPLPQRHVR